MNRPIRRLYAFLLAGAFLLAVTTLAWGQFANKTSNVVGTIGSACTGANIDYAWPDTNGNVLKCVANVWTAVPLYWNTANTSVGIGTTNPMSMLQVSGGEVQVGSSGASCAAANNGAIRYSGGTVYYCTGSTWTSMSGGGGGSGTVSLGSQYQMAYYAANGTTVVGHPNIVTDANNDLSIGTSSAIYGALKIAGMNGISFPAADKNQIGGSIAIGSSALANMPTAVGTSMTYDNIAIGYQSMENAGMTTAAIGNVALGYQALRDETSGTYNVAIGYQALASNTTGGGNGYDSNTAVGSWALSLQTASSQNTAVGNRALSATLGSYNTAVGASAGAGYLASGSGNTYIGHTTANYLVTGDANTVVGANAAGNQTNGSGNTIFGMQAGGALNAANANTIMGYKVGNTTLSTGNNNILIGTDNTVDTPTSTTNNFLNIGNLIYGTSIGTAATPGNVGIGTANPRSTLDINGTLSFKSAGSTSYWASSGCCNNDGVALNFANGDTFLQVELSIKGTDDVFLQGIPHSPAGYTIMEGSGGAGLVVGTYNATTPVIFQINRVEKARVDGSGYLGIGTTAPAYLLHVGSATASGTVMELQNSSGACTFAPGTSSLATTCSSDMRLKENIHDTTDALPWLADMRVRDFTVKATGESSTGVIAQEMLVNHPDMVRANSEGFYGVDVPNPWKMIKALQELIAMNDSLKAANDNLEAETASLKAANDNEAAEIKDLQERLGALEAAQP